MGINYPMGNYYPQQQYQPAAYYQQQQQNNSNVTTDERIWVQSEASAEAYLLAPNSFVRLWDSSAPRYYEKRSDATGRPMPIDIYEYKRVLPQNSANNSDMDKTLYNELNDKIEAFSARLEALENNKKGASKNAKQSAADDTSV